MTKPLMLLGVVVVAVAGVGWSVYSGKQEDRAIRKAQWVGAAVGSCQGVADLFGGLTPAPWEMVETCDRALEDFVRGREFPPLKSENVAACKATASAWREACQKSARALRRNEFVCEKSSAHLSDQCDVSAREIRLLKP